ncbi:MAG: hypothetical protein LBU07_06295 [Coriobacteriales bacterium]|jgi:hypothetical protein|nr:hypothetical protein [Coriobacteriales bacterium]
MSDIRKLLSVFLLLILTTLLLVGSLTTRLFPADATQTGLLQDTSESTSGMGDIAGRDPTTPAEATASLPAAPGASVAAENSVSDVSATTPSAESPPPQNPAQSPLVEDYPEEDTDTGTIEQVEEPYWQTDTVYAELLAAYEDAVGRAESTGSILDAVFEVTSPATDNFGGEITLGARDVVSSGTNAPLYDDGLAYLLTPREGFPDVGTHSDRSLFVPVPDAKGVYEATFFFASQTWPDAPYLAFRTCVVLTPEKPGVDAEDTEPLAGSPDGTEIKSSNDGLPPEEVRDGAVNSLEDDTTQDVTHTDRSSALSSRSDPKHVIVPDTETTPDSLEMDVAHDGEKSRAPSEEAPEDADSWQGQPLSFQAACDRYRAAKADANRAGDYLFAAYYTVTDSLGAADLSDGIANEIGGISVVRGSELSSCTYGYLLTDATTAPAIGDVSSAALLTKLYENGSSITYEALYLFGNLEEGLEGAVVGGAMVTVLKPPLLSARGVLRAQAAEGPLFVGDTWSEIAWVYFYGYVVPPYSLPSQYDLEGYIAQQHYWTLVNCQNPDLDFYVPQPNNGEYYQTTATVRCTSINPTAGTATFWVLITTPGGYQDLGGSVTISWQFYGWLELVKRSYDPLITEGNSRYNFSNAQYAIYDEWDTYIRTLTTNSNGLAAANQNGNYLPGWYKIKETRASEGYMLDPRTYWIEVKSGTTSSVNGGAVLEPPITGTINLTKVSANTTITTGNTRYSLSGAAYGVYRTSTDATQNRNAVTTITTDTSGKGSASGLALGVYYVREITAPEGYELDAQTYIVDIKTSATTVSVSCRDTPITGTIDLSKGSRDPAITAGNTRYSLTGAVYSVYQSHAAAVELEEPFVTTKTDAEGKGRVSGLALGYYYVRECIAPEGYELDTEIYTVDITSKLTTICFTHDDIPITGSIKVIKRSANPSVTAGNECYSLAGAVYGVYLTQKDAEEAANTHVVITTDTDGRGASSGLALNPYFIRELVAPEGYQLDARIYPVDIATDMTAISFEHSDEPIVDTAALIAQKLDSETGQAWGKDDPEGASLAGAEFTLRYWDGFYDSLTDAEASGEPTRTWIFATVPGGLLDLSSPDTYTFISGDPLYHNDRGDIIIPLGTIIIEETKPPDAYLLPSPQEVFVQQIGSLDNQLDPVRCLITLVIAEHPHAAVVKKIDSDTEVPLPDTEFTLYRESEPGTEDWVEVSRHVTNADGTCVFSPLAVGSYKLVETKEHPRYATVEESGGTEHYFIVTNETGTEFHLFENDLITVAVETYRTTIPVTATAHDATGYGLNSNVNKDTGSSEYLYHFGARSLANVRVDEFVLTDSLLPATELGYRLTTLWTGTSPAGLDHDGLMAVLYKTNLTAADELLLYDSDPMAANPDNANNPNREAFWSVEPGWRIWEEQLSTTEPTRMDVSALGLAQGEYLTHLRVVYGGVERGFFTGTQHEANDVSTGRKPEDMFVDRGSEDMPTDVGSEDVSFDRESGYLPTGVRFENFFADRGFAGVSLDAGLEKETTPIETPIETTSLRDWSYAVKATNALPLSDERGNETVIGGLVTANLFRNWNDVTARPVLLDEATDRTETRVVDSFAYPREGLGLVSGSWLADVDATVNAVVSDGAPQTGDSIPLALLILVIILAIFGIGMVVAFLVLRLRHKRRSQGFVKAQVLVCVLATFLLILAALIPCAHAIAVDATELASSAASSTNTDDRANEGDSKEFAGKDGAEKEGANEISEEETVSLTHRKAGAATEREADSSTDTPLERSFQRSRFAVVPLDGLTSLNQYFPERVPIADGTFEGTIGLDPHKPYTLYERYEAIRDQVDRVVIIEGLPDNNAQRIARYREFDVRSASAPDATERVVLECAFLDFRATEFDHLGLPSSYTATVTYRGQEEFLVLDHYEVEAHYVGILTRPDPDDTKATDKSIAEPDILTVADTDVSLNSAVDVPPLIPVGIAAASAVTVWMFIYVFFRSKPFKVCHRQAGRYKLILRCPVKRLNTHLLVTIRPGIDLNYGRSMIGLLPKRYLNRGLTIEVRQAGVCVYGGEILPEMPLMNLQTDFDRHLQKADVSQAA